MMRLTTPFPNLNNVIGDVPHDVMWLIIGQGLDYFRRHRKTLFNLRNIRKNFGWFKIMCYIISLGMTLSVWDWSTKFHSKPLTKFCYKVIIYDLKAGYRTLCKTEPKLAKDTHDLLMTFYNDYKVYKVTGVKSALFQKVFPDVTP